MSTLVIYDSQYRNIDSQDRVSRKKRPIRSKAGLTPVHKRRRYPL
jgi:hypothetical protein